MLGLYLQWSNLDPKREETPMGITLLQRIINPRAKGTVDDPEEIWPEKFNNNPRALIAIWNFIPKVNHDCPLWQAVIAIFKELEKFDIEDNYCPTIEVYNGQDQKPQVLIMVDRPITTGYIAKTQVYGPADELIAIYNSLIIFTIDIHRSRCWRSRSWITAWLCALGFTEDEAHMLASDRDFHLNTTACYFLTRLGLQLGHDVEECLELAKQIKREADVDAIIELLLEDRSLGLDDAVALACPIPRPITHT